jgi:hypothetical protein
VVFGAGVATGVLAGVEVAGVFVGAGVAAGVLVGAGVVAEAVLAPGGGANTAAPATPGTASASATKPHRAILKGAAWMIGDRIGLMGSGLVGRILARTVARIPPARRLGKRPQSTHKRRP